MSLGMHLWMASVRGPCRPSWGSVRRAAPDFRVAQLQPHLRNQPIEGILCLPLCVNLSNKQNKSLAEQELATSEMEALTLSKAHLPSFPCRIAKSFSPTWAAGKGFSIGNHVAGYKVKHWNHTELGIFMDGWCLQTEFTKQTENA